MNEPLRGHRRRGWTVAGAMLLAAGALAAAPLPSAWKNWRYSRAVELSPTDTTRLAGVVVPQEVYARAQINFSDVRVIDDTGAEVPYASYVRQGSTTSASVPTTLRENSFAPGLYTQVVIDFGERSPFHNTVELTTPETDFIEWASVEASDDAHVWRIVQKRAPIFRFQKEGRQGTQTLHYSENNARYLRIRILDGAKQFPITGANTLDLKAVPPESAAIAPSIARDPSAPANQTAWRIDLGASLFDLRTLEFKVGPAEFSRNVEVSGSADGTEWTPFAYGQIYRFHQGDAVEEHLTIPVGSYLQRRYLRVAILNGNDTPLPDVTLAFYISPQHIVFEQQPGRSYRLLYGQSRAQRPEYDLVRRVMPQQEDAAIAGQLGPEEENANYSDPRPWTEKNTYVLWIVVGIAVLLLGYSAIRSLRRSSADAPPRI
jgi:hypothetical protein